MKLNEDFTDRPLIADIGRWHITRFVESAAAQLPAESRILDAGAGECAYKRFFVHCRYLAVDLAVGETAWNYANLDCVAALERIPFRDSTFDAVLCTQALEHVESPWTVLAEMQRILKPGGRLFLTAPMAHEEHQTPYDFFRYTSFGLRSLCNRAGFAEVEVVPFGGLFTRWAYELPRALQLLSATAKTGSGKLMRRIITGILVVLIRLIQALLLSLDRYDRSRRDPFGWSVTAVKKGEPCIPRV